MLVSAEARTHGPDVHTTRLSRGLHFSRRFKDEKDDETKKLSVNYCTKENIQMSFAVTSFLCWGRIEAVRTVEVVRTTGASRFISWKTFSPPSSINNFDTKLLLNVHNTTTLAFYATFSYAFDQVFICFLICIFTCVLYTLSQAFNSTFSNAFYFTFHMHFIVRFHMLFRISFHLFSMCVLWGRFYFRFRVSFHICSKVYFMCVVMLIRNKALWLDLPNHMTFLTNQSA